MKRTSSMIYKPTEESRELYIVAENESRVYPMIQAIENSLIKKINKGIFEADRATEAFYHVMQEVARQYKKDFGYMFTVTEKWTAAQDMATAFIQEVTA